MDTFNSRDFLSVGSSRIFGSTSSFVSNDREQINLFLSSFDWITFFVFDRNTFCWKLRAL